MFISFSLSPQGLGNIVKFAEAIGQRFNPNGVTEGFDNVTLS
jgi:hypothetical protein